MLEIVEFVEDGIYVCGDKSSFLFFGVKGISV